MFIFWYQASKYSNNFSIFLINVNRRTRRNFEFVLTHFWPMFPFIPSENPRKPKTSENPRKPKVMEHWNTGQKWVSLYFLKLLQSNHSAIATHEQQISIRTFFNLRNCIGYLPTCDCIYFCKKFSIFRCGRSRQSKAKCTAIIYQ